MKESKVYVKRVVVYMNVKGCALATSNSTGQEKGVFNLSQNVYVSGGNFPLDINVTSYVIPTICQLHQTVLLLLVGHSQILWEKSI